MLPKTALCMNTLFTSLNQTILQHKNQTQQTGFKLKRLTLLRLEKQLSNQVDCFCSMMHPTLPLIPLNREKEENIIKQDKIEKKKAKQNKEQQLQKQEKKEEVQQTQQDILIYDEQQLSQDPNKKISPQKTNKIEEQNQISKAEESEEITLESLLVTKPVNNADQIMQGIRKTGPKKKRSKEGKKATKNDNKILNQNQDSSIDSGIYLSDSSESIKVSSVLRQKNKSAEDFECEDDEKNINKDYKIQNDDKNTRMDSSKSKRKVR